MSALPRAGPAVRGCWRLRLWWCRRGSHLVSCRMHELGQVRDYGLHHTRWCLDLAGEAEGSLGAFIVSVIGYSYMVTLLPLWPTMPSYPSITLVVLAVSRVITKRGVDHLTTDEDEPAHAIKRSRVDSPTTSRSPLTVLVNSIVVNTILLEFGISFLAGL
ncbi:hypothetical protein GW17_00044044 [Ensete ventricosum]|nr:hypothetical protein GW17_00044044 [Ensete ventricosum]